MVRVLSEASRRDRLVLAVSMMDLTMLGERDTPEEARALCANARAPLGASAPTRCAAVCVHAHLVATAKESLAGSRVRVATVAGAFPSGIATRAAKVDEVRRAIDLGADEVDVVMDRRPLLAGDDGAVHDEIAAMKAAAGATLLKVILETGELGSDDVVRRASEIAMRAGADFLKTSTGKVAIGATPRAARAMLEAIRDFHREHGQGARGTGAQGRRVGFKVAGGVRTADQALAYLALVEEILGAEWLAPDRMRIGASSLLDDVRAELARTSPRT